MAGKIKVLLDKIIEERAKGNLTIAMATKTKLVLKGLNPDKFTSLSEDTPEIMQKVLAAANEFGVKVM